MRAKANEKYEQFYEKEREKLKDLEKIAEKYYRTSESERKNKKPCEVPRHARLEDELEEAQNLIEELREQIDRYRMGEGSFYSLDNLSLDSLKSEKSNSLQASNSTSSSKIEIPETTNNQNISSFSTLINKLSQIPNPGY